MGGSFGLAHHLLVEIGDEICLLSTEVGHLLVDGQIDVHQGQLMPMCLRYLATLKHIIQRHLIFKYS